LNSPDGFLDRTFRGQSDLEEPRIKHYGKHERGKRGKRATVG
jgi:hypothetical protein